MLELEEALGRILESIPAPTPETVPLSAADGRVLLETVRARVDLPPFDNSSVDGYAVRAADTTGATPEKPARLQLVGRVEAGASFTATVGDGQCARLFTGAPLPAGADAVVMQEDVRVDPSDARRVLVLDGVHRSENVRFQGEDVRHGAALASPGEVLNAAKLSLLGAAGADRVSAGIRPVVGVLATGSELMEPGQPLAPGQIYESNRTGLAALIANAGAIPRVLPIVPDSLELTRAALAYALGGCDIVVTCGGVSVGEMDFVKSAFEELGGKLDFWKVAVKPGKPFVFGRRQTRFLFGLPGNPVSAVVTFLLLVRPALRRWQGAADVGPHTVQAIAAEPLPNGGDRRLIMRVRLDSSGRVHSAGLQGAHVLSSLAAANALVDVPPHTTVSAGAPVTAILLA